jgi:hypothetical protein
MRGIINKYEDTFCVEFKEVQYTDDGFDYQGSDIVEIYPEDIIEFNITDEMIGEEVEFTQLWIVDKGEEFYYTRLKKII